MKCRSPLIILAMGLGSMLTAVPTVWAQDDGPVIELPDEANGDEEPSGDFDAAVRGLREERFERAERTSIGGYGELHYNHVIPEGEAESTSEIDLHRLVVFIAHVFSQDIRFYAEVEVEHAFVAGGDSPGQVGVEQAYIEWALLGDALGLRAGILLVPMGFINQWHEPPIFHGVERPRVDNRIIPTTWREGGLGVFGQPAAGLQYELYLISGLNPLGFSAGSGLRGGRQHVAEARADGLAVTARLEYEPLLGLLFGLSGYFGHAGPNAGDLFQLADDGSGAVSALDIDVPVVGASADVRLNRWGIEARGLVAWFSIGDTEQLREATDADGEVVGPDVGSQLFGAYLEAGYNVLRAVDTDHQLVPFVRYELYDTGFEVEGGSSVGERSVSDLVFGITYRPVSAVAFKSDVIQRTPEAGTSETIVDLGIGWMF